MPSSIRVSAVSFKVDRAIELWKLTVLMVTIQPVARQPDIIIVQALARPRGQETTARWSDP